MAQHPALHEDIASQERRESPIHTDSYTSRELVINLLVIHAPRLDIYAHVHTPTPQECQTHKRPKLRYLNTTHAHPRTAAHPCTHSTQLFRLGNTHWAFWFTVSSPVSLDVRVRDGWSSEKRRRCQRILGWNLG